MELPKMTVKEIEEYVIDDSPIFGIPSFKDILRINVNESYYRSFKRVIQDSLMDLNRKMPIYMNSTIYLPLDSTPYEFKDNLQAYLDGKIDKKFLTLIPTAVVNLGGTMLTAARTFTYRDGQLSDPTMTGSCQVEYLANHPFICKKQEVEDEFTDDSAVYGVKEGLNFKSNMFLKLVLYNLTCKILELKTQVNYTEIPIEIFSGLQEKKSELDQIVNEFMLSPSVYSNLWR